MTLVDLVTSAARRWPDKTAWLFDATGERFTFADIDARSSQIAVALRTRCRAG
jgi:crotonobetaine/carnitine-CoA ligase